jgi:WD40 repeat protein
VLRGHDGPVAGVGFSADRRWLFTAGSDGAFKSWDLAIEPEGLMLRKLPAPVVAIATRTNSSDFAIAYADGSVAVAAGSRVPSRLHPSDGRRPLSLLRFPDKGEPLGVEVTENAVKVWEFSAPPRVLFERSAAATAIDLHLTTRTLVLGDAQGRVTLWSLLTYQTLGSFDTGQAPVRHLAVSEDGQWIAAGAGDRAIGVWAVGGSAHSYRLPGRTDPWIVKFIGNDRLAVAARGGSIRIWTLPTGKEDIAMHGHLGRINALAISPDRYTLVSGTATGEVKLWDLRTGSELVNLVRHRGAVHAADFTWDGRLLITGSSAPGEKGELAFWDAPPE